MSQRTADQLRRLRHDNLLTLAQSEGVEVEGDATKDQIITALAEAGKVAEGKEPEAKKQPAKAELTDPSGVKVDQRHSPFAHEEHFLVTIHSTDDEDGSRAVDVTVNGHNWRIPRDQEVPLPRSALEVLENSIQTRLDEVGRDRVTGAPDLVERNSRRFAFASRAA